MKQIFSATKSKFLLVFSFVVLLYGNSFAATYYVATTGSNSNAGFLASPWQTLTYAATRLAAGDMLYVRGGTYVESMTVWVSGTAAAPIAISAYPGEKPVIDGQNTYPTTNWGALVKFSTPHY